MNSCEDRRKTLIEEINNFEEIARYLKPSSGEIPAVSGIDIFGDTVPLSVSIGGDHIIYVDFNKRYDIDLLANRSIKRGRSDIADRLEKNRNKAGVLLADVSGHMITDAMLAAMLHQAFLTGVVYELMYNGTVTTNLFEIINSRFYKSSAVSKYITMIYGEISETGMFDFISAGHPPPIVFSNEYDRIVDIAKETLVTFPPIGTIPSKEDTEIERLESHLGYKDDYKLNEISLMGSGDILILYTDGFYEHENREGINYVQTGFESKLRECKGFSAKKICGELLEDIKRFADTSDDISLVIIKKS
jgi:serine phosphatase RsbU (regulator of sigma subunit)